MGYFHNQVIKHTYYETITSSVTNGFLYVLKCWDTLESAPDVLMYLALEGWDSRIHEPVQVNCWDVFTFNTTTCSWDTSGSQPSEPVQVNCWDVFTFNTTTCSWDTSGSQPSEPVQVNCWDVFTFNTTTCSWDTSGSQPQRVTSKLLGCIYFTLTLGLG